MIIKHKLIYVTILLLINSIANSKDVQMTLQNYEYDFAGIATNDSVWVAVGSQGQIWYSKDSLALKWKRALSPTTYLLSDVSWCGDAFYAVSNSGEIITSQDGIQWSKINVQSDRPLFQIERTAFGLVAVGADGTVLTEDNTVGGWKDTVMSSVDFNSIAVQDSIVMIAGDSGVCFWNKNGTNWIPDSIPTTQSIIRVIWSNREKAFIYLGHRGDRFKKDSNGWITYASPDTSLLFNGLIETNNGYLAVGDFGNWCIFSDSINGNSECEFHSQGFIELAIQDTAVVAAGYSGLIAKWNSTEKVWEDCNGSIASLSGGVYFKNELVFFNQHSIGGTSAHLLIIDNQNLWRFVPIRSYSGDPMSSKMLFGLYPTAQGLAIIARDGSSNLYPWTIYSGLYNHGDSVVVIRPTNLRMGSSLKIISSDSALYLINDYNIYSSNNGLDWVQTNQLILRGIDKSDTLKARYINKTDDYFYVVAEHIDLGKPMYGLIRSKNLIDWEKIQLPGWHADKLFSLGNEVLFLHPTIEYGYDHIYGLHDSSSSWIDYRFTDIGPSLIATNRKVAFAIQEETLMVSLNRGESFIPVIDRENLLPISLCIDSYCRVSTKAVLNNSNADSGLIWFYYDNSIKYGTYNIIENEIPVATQPVLTAKQEISFINGYLKLPIEFDGIAQITITTLRGERLWRATVDVDKEGSIIDLRNALTINNDVLYVYVKSTHGTYSRRILFKHDR